MTQVPLRTDVPAPADLALLRAEFGDGGPDGEDALGWEAVRAFETRHSVVLPEPYRTFVADITDGSGLGPTDCSGILPLEALPNDWDGDSTERDLAAPFPLTERWIWEDDPRPGEEIGPLIDRVFNHGSVVLGTDGCGMNWHLIVTGEHRGHIWFICGEGATPFGAPFGGTTAEPGFAGWIRHWATGQYWWDVPEAS